MLKFWIPFGLLSLLFLTVLELNKNTLVGWVFTIVVLAIFAGWFVTRLAGKAWYVKGFSWLALAAVFAIIVYLTWPPLKLVPAVDRSKTSSPSIPAVARIPYIPAQTQFGPVKGVISSDGIVVYAGIPYAAPPVGDLRWRPPQDPEPWEGTLICDHFAPMAMQTTNLPIYDSLAQIIGYHDYKISLRDNYRAPVSEDCLYLNIWAPEHAVPDSKLPVVVYIHGGSLQTGQPWYQDYSGEAFAQNGVICVNMGYRLGVFGFLADETLLAEDGTTGNYGLLDQIKALEWVQNNIEAFGGDPDNVTLVGESAGAVCVDALCVSPLAKGLFRRAILESSTLASEEPPHSYRTFDDAIASGKELLARHGCSTVDELRALSSEELVSELNTQHHVTVDGYVLPDSPKALREAGIHNEEAVIHGYNAEESGPFIIFSHAKLKNYESKVRGYFKEYADEVLALYPASTDEEADSNWAQIWGAVFFNYPHYCLSRLEAANGVPNYEYYFSKDNGRLGSWHSGELVYAFGMIPDDSSLYDSDDRRVSRIMHSYWINFAKTGDPNGAANAHNYDTEEPQFYMLPEFPDNTDCATLLELGDHVGVISEKYLALYEILDRMQGYGQ